MPLFLIVAQIQKVLTRVILTALIQNLTSLVRKRKSKKSTKRKKSGINANDSDRVKNPQKWPHSHLQFEHVNKQVKFDELNFQLFVAGELEIIS